MSVPIPVMNTPPCGTLDPATLPSGLVEGLYVHIPFCFHKCHYCDFYSITRQTPDRMDRFVDRLLVEAEKWGANQRGPTPRPRTIFFGGGTPSLLPAPAMERLLRGLRDRFDLSHLDEWTVEINPATADLDYCRMLREAGVDRLSFGAQSFSPAELQVLERHHEPADVERSIKLARKAGFERLNLDFIYAIPGQDLASWMESLERAIAMQTEHLSCYGLTYEPNTPLAVRRRLGAFQPAEEDLELEMFRATRRRLKDAGRPAYEISNFAVVGAECRHNLHYWHGGNYVGLGPSAASHVEGYRWRNRPHLREWEEAIDAGELPATELESLSPSRRRGELAMLTLRLSGGLNFADFADRTGCDARAVFAEPIQRLQQHGLLTIDQTAGRLTDRGLELADAIAAEFLDVAESSAIPGLAPGIPSG